MNTEDQVYKLLFAIADSDFEEYDKEQFAQNGLDIVTLSMLPANNSVESVISSINSRVSQNSNNGEFKFSNFETIKLTVEFLGVVIKTVQMVRDYLKDSPNKNSSTEDIRLKWQKELKAAGLSEKKSERIAIAFSEDLKNILVSTK